MIVKAQGPDEALGPLEGLDPVLASYYRIMRLKRLYRQGWLKRGIRPETCESVAEHSFGTALLALLLLTGREAEGFAGLDRSRVLELALVHELGETYAGDITPVDGVSPEDKARRERAAIDKALAEHGGGAALLALWEEFEAGSSAEARFVRELDRLEMGFEAALHRAEGSELMEEFYESARRTVRSPALRGLLEAAVRQAELAATGETGSEAGPGAGD